ncbi:hypothetical protein HMPREF9699_01067 [Bergeyella zoohelcum ATCC 43767]|uniref:Prenyltransferase n=2 Tax=Bergeyella zoohelcum TaxID=1015 RepID=K1LRP4_9FLAO|nr:hypothetical protein HMPREF9699_01067 [Bergeyella zoohelcum ATCC 43767]SUV48749.1 prenyltransferase [Bergeyella zoohelcum]
MKLSINIPKKLGLQYPIFVATMGTLLAVFFMLEKDIIHWKLVVLVFFSYFNGYLYTKNQHKKELLRPILIINITCFIFIAGFLIFSHSFKTLYKWLFIILLGLLYNSRQLKLYIRKIPFMKIFYVGLVWGLVNGWLIFPEIEWYYMLITALYITALIIPFDIRDKNLDKIMTIPKAIGNSKSKLFAIILLIISTIISYNTLDTKSFFALSISSLLSMALILLTQENRPKYFYSVIMESCCGLPLMLWYCL